MGIFGPKKATAKTYVDFEKNLYLALEVFKKMAQKGDKDGKYYLVNSMDPSYKKAFNLSFGLVKFYTKNLEGNTPFKFKRNFLLSKTRGIFSDQKKQKSQMLADIYMIPIEQLDKLPEEYFTMFHMQKSFDDPEPDPKEEPKK